MAAKSERMLSASAALRTKLAELAPDVLVIFGDDQYECFTFDNFPAIVVYLGAEFGWRSAKGAERAAGHPALGDPLLTGLMARGFDPAFSMGLPEGRRGRRRATTNPLGYYGAWSIPTVPLLMNAYYAPQLSARATTRWVGRRATSSRSTPTTCASS